MNKRPEYDLKVVGRNLKRLREKMNLSVEQVREYLCLGSVQAVYKYESGKSYPQADTMFALMELYGAGIKDIVCEEALEASSFFVRIARASEQASGVLLHRYHNRRLCFCCYLQQFEYGV